MKSITKLFTQTVLSLAVATTAYAAPTKNACIARLYDYRQGESLYLPGCNITDQDVPDLVDFLNDPKASDVSRLYLDDNKLTAKGINQLLVVEKIKDVSLTGNELKDSDAASIAKSMASNHALNSLDLGHNALTEEGVAALAKLTNVPYLGLGDTDGVTDRTVKMLTSNPYFEFLDLSYDHISPAAFAMLIQDMRLVGVNLDSNPISTQELELVSSRGLWQILSLAHNHITDEGAKAIAPAYLDSLDLSNNEITEAGLQAFSYNRTLKSLALMGNKIKDADFSRLAFMQRIETLDLTANQIGDKGFASLAAIQSPQSENGLQALEVAMNQISDQGALEYAKNVKHVEFLDVANNNITATGFNALKAQVEAGHIGMLMPTSGMQATAKATPEKTLHRNSLWMKAVRKMLNK